MVTRPWVCISARRYSVLPRLIVTQQTGLSAKTPTDRRSSLPSAANAKKASANQTSAKRMNPTLDR